jgi:uncharacterized repeat protein (TIGR01451 family)/CSLREA domain-containing protein
MIDNGAPSMFTDVVSSFSGYRKGESMEDEKAKGSRPPKLLLKFLRGCLSITAALMAVIAFSSVVNAADLTVNTPNDEYDVAPNATCSLREAIQSANQDSDFGGCVAVGAYGNDTIRFGPGISVVQLSLSSGVNNDDNSFLDLDINDPSFPNSLTISGPPGKVTVETVAAWTDRIFDIPSGSSPQGDILLENLVIRGGAVDFTATPETGMVCSFSGGGVRAIGSNRSLTLRNVRLQDNEVVGGNGGGACEKFNGNFVLETSEVLSNTADASPLSGGQGGGLWLGGGPFPRTILTSTVAYNRSEVEGGGVANLTTRGLQIDDSRVLSNVAGYLQVGTGLGGGGIWSVSGLNLNNTDVMSNVVFYDPSTPSLWVAGGGGIHQATGATGPLTIAGGQISYNHVRAILNGSAVGGGGVLNAGSAASLNAVRIEFNVVDTASPLVSADVYGGGVLNQQQKMSIVRGTISHNRIEATNASGGGIASYAQITPPGGQLFLNSVTVANNSASGTGGGLVSGGGINIVTLVDTVIVDSSLIQSNTVSGSGALLWGGGIHSNGEMTVINSSIVGNVGGQRGGGVLNSYLFHSINATLSGNSAASGGGLYNFNSFNTTSYLTHTTIANSTGGGLHVEPGAPVEVLATLLANNAGGNCTGAAVTHNGASLSDDASCTGFAFTNVNPLLQPLALNGGATPNHALGAGSPAIDQAGACNGYGVISDQRGLARPQGAACDIGAFELEEADLSVNKTAFPASVMSGETITYTVLVVNLSSFGSALNIVLTDTLTGGASFGGVVNGGGFTLQSSSSGQAIFTLPTLAAGAGTTLIFTATAPTLAGAVVNTATVASGNPDPGLVNNVSVVNTPVTPVANLQIGKMQSYQAILTNTVASGATISYTLLVTNTGPSPAASVVVTDVLPTGMNFIGASGAGWSCGFSAPSVICSAPSLALGPAPAITIEASAAITVGLTLTNTATVHSATHPATPVTSNAVSVNVGAANHLPVIFKQP